MDTRSLEIAECVLLGAGTAIAIGFCCAAIATRKLRATLALGPGPTSTIESTDVLVAFASMLILPALFDSILGSLAISQTVTTSMPTSGPAEPNMLLRSGSVLLGQVAASLVMLLIGRGRSTNGLRGWGLSSDGIGRRILHALLAYLCIWPVCYGLLVATLWSIRRLVPTFEVAEHESIALLIGPEASSAVRAITISSALVMAAVQEELFFRGLLQQWLRRVTGSGWTAIALTACAFGLFHWPLFQTMPALAAFSALLGILYFKTGSLTLVILLHAVFNGKTLLWIALGAQP